MADFDLDWKGDLSLDASGDIAMVDGVNMANQHIIRRLLTSTGAYDWHLEYGAGLVDRIGKVALAANIASLIRANIKLEKTVALVPAPKITVNADETVFGLFNILIIYTSTATGLPTQLNFEVPTK